MKKKTEFENRVIESFRSENPDLQGHLTNDLISTMLTEAQDTRETALITAKLGLQADISGYKVRVESVEGGKVTLDGGNFQKMKSGQIRNINEQIDQVKKDIGEKEDVFIVSDDNIQDLAKDYAKLEGLLEARQDFYKENNPDQPQMDKGAGQESTKDRLSTLKTGARRLSQRASGIFSKASQAQSQKSDMGQEQDAQKDVEVQGPKIDSMR